MNVQDCGDFRSSLPRACMTSLLRYSGSLQEKRHKLLRPFNELPLCIKIKCHREELKTNFVSITMLLSIVVLFLEQDI